MPRRLLPLLVVLATFSTVPARVFANPVSTEMADEFRGLVRATADIGRCPDSPLLVLDFGRFGLALLSRDDRQAIRDHFETFLPLLAAAQGPPYAPHFDVHDVFLDAAGPKQADREILSLRRWLTEEVHEAPWRGTMRRNGERGIREAVTRCRVEAAEMLAEWGDTASLPALRKLAIQELGEERVKLIRRSIARMGDPCAQTVLRRGAGGKLEWCLRAKDIVSARVSRYCRSQTEPGWQERNLGAAEIKKIVELLPTSQRGEVNGSQDRTKIRLDLASGFQVTLVPAEFPYVRLEDSSTRRNRGWGWVLENGELHRFLSNLMSCEREAP